MIFINHQKSATAAKDYYTQHIAPGDGKYYTEANAQQMKGLWHGRGADMLRLSGEVRQEDFFKLCDNINPVTGERLTMRNDIDRRVMTDLTFDVPKSVTLAYELGGDGRILDKFRESVRETMAEIEMEVATRVRNKGADHDRTTGNIIWAEHIHKTARPVTKDDQQTVDPQLHAHATVFNATFDPEEKRWKAIQLGDIVRDKGYYQAALHARMASKLKALGYGIEKDGNSFRLAGISRETVEKFSQRHGVINKEAERRGANDPKSKAKIARQSREKKNPEPRSMEELRKEWDSRLRPEERLALRTASMGTEKGDAAITPDQAKAYALEHAFERASAVSEKRLKAEALAHAVGWVTPDDVADIAQHPEVIAKERDGQVMTTTKTVLRDELAMLQFAKDGQRAFKPLVTDAEQLKEALAGLSGEQRQAALLPLTSRDQVMGIRGGAGTGKTHMMQTVNAVINGIENGQGEYNRVFAFAQSSGASRGELRKVGFKNAETLAALFNSEKMQANLHRQVILVDEAGQVSSKDMRRLFDIAKKQEARVILVGDYRQHSSVEAGDAFRLIEKEAGIRYAQLTEIRRQTTPGYKKAVEHISSGTRSGAQKGFDALDKMGWIVEASGEDRHRLLVKDYLNAQEEGKSALIIAPTHAEGQRLTDELRTALKQRGALGQEYEFITRKSTGWTDAQKGDARNYEQGMVLEFHQNAKGFKRGEKLVVVEPPEIKAIPKLGRRGAKESAGGLMVLKEDGSRAILPIEQAQRFDVYRTRAVGIAKGDRIRVTKNGEAKIAGQAKCTRFNNGDVFAVEGFDKEGNINLGRGRYLPKSWGHLSLGYVDTSYASQGKTVDRVFIATGKESLPASNQQQWYVSASRGREMAKVYVDDKQEVRDAIARTGQRLSAVELTHTQLRAPWRERFRQTLERNRVGRFLKQRAQAVSDYMQRKEGVSYA
ncbi:MAG: relaxase domain-containing protein [Acidobacteriia bacterium]|nr:relaxase domain-containing protein [Terriglobia bacterium]